MANHEVHKTPPRTRVDVNSLLSPPELKRSGSFGSSIAKGPPSIAPYGCEPAKSPMCKPAAVGHAYNTPPFSPEKSFSLNPSSPSQMAETSGTEGVRDPQLFFRGSDASSVKDYPLFPRESVSDSEDTTIIAHHMNSHNYAVLSAKPTFPEYKVVAAVFRSTAWGEYRKDARRWWKQEREFEKQYGKNRAQSTQKRFKQHESKCLAPAPSSHRKDNKVAIPRVPKRIPRTSKPVTKVQRHDSMGDDTPHAVPAPFQAPKQVKKPDRDWRDIPDFCPPLSTLDEQRGKLKAEWKSGPFQEIADQPEAQYMHEEEIRLAQTLRLQCAQYLHSKRSIFEARVKALKAGKDFRRTDAQMACRIDVNKASRLWQAFEKVGWLDRHHFERYLQYV